MQIMLGKQTHTGQFSLYDVRLDNLIDLGHPLAILAREVDWEFIEGEIAPCFSHTGRPSVPARSLVGMLMLKRMFNESDESVVARWIENPYWQHFTGEEYFQKRKPLDPSEFVHFRKRIGPEKMEALLAATVRLHKGAESEQEVQVDSTAQEKNITFPTDAKLRKKVIDKCNKIARKEKIDQRQSYKWVSKKLLRQSYFGHHPKRKKKAVAARKKLATMAGRLIRELERKLPEGKLEEYRPHLELYKRVINQEKNEGNKIYSLHEPQVSCIAKGKAHKKYEFGSKVVLVRGAKTGVITAGCNFQGNPHDSRTLEDTLEQSRRICAMASGERPAMAVTDRGFRGKRAVGATQIAIPDTNTQGRTDYQKRKARKRFRARAAIEPVIGHIKHDHRMIRNFLKGRIGDDNNPLLAAIGFNLKKRFNQIVKQIAIWLQVVLGIIWRKAACPEAKLSKMSF